MDRKTSEERKTNETDIKLDLSIDGTGNASVSTGIGFFDHMLTSLCIHAGWDLSLTCNGDLDIDGHHTIEDVGIVLGKAFGTCISDKKGLARYGSFFIPMDEALASAHTDLSGRPYLVFDADFRAEKIGDLDTQLILEFFRAFAMNAQITLHLAVIYGENDHHKVEALFKALAHSLKTAVQKDGDALLSAKGSL